MDDLPLPTQSQPNQGSQMPIEQQRAFEADITDPKALLVHATELVEAAVARTPSNPTARANDIQAIKAAYQKARYGAVAITAEGK